MGFLFLILYPAPASPSRLPLPPPAPASGPRRLRFVTHSLPHTTLSHTIFHTRLCHTQLCHTQSFTHNFVTHNLSHTTLSHSSSHTTVKMIDLPPSPLSFLLSPLSPCHFFYWKKLTCGVIRSFNWPQLATIQHLLVFICVHSISFYLFLHHCILSFSPDVSPLLKSGITLVLLRFQDQTDFILIQSL